MVTENKKEALQKANMGTRVTFARSSGSRFLFTSCSLGKTQRLLYACARAVAKEATTPRPGPPTSAASAVIPTKRNTNVLFAKLEKRGVHIVNYVEELTTVHLSPATNATRFRSMLAAEQTTANLMFA